MSRFRKRHHDTCIVHLWSAARLVIGAMVLSLAILAHATAEPRHLALSSQVDVADLHPDVREIQVECRVEFSAAKVFRTGTERRSISPATHGFFGEVTNRVRYESDADGTPTGWRCVLKLVIGDSVFEPVLNGLDVRTRAVGTLEAERSGSLPPP